MKVRSQNAEVRIKNSYKLKVLSFKLKKHFTLHDLRFTFCFALCTTLSAGLKHRTLNVEHSLLCSSLQAPCSLLSVLFNKPYKPNERNKPDKLKKPEKPYKRFLFC